MKFTISWLKEYLETDADLDQVVDAMTMAGLEVEEVEDPAAKLADFSIAKVIDAQPHPDADKLQVCTVETKDGVKQIVCGAPNARKGLTGIYAPLGTYIPGLDFSLDPKPRKIRGVESHGMLCSVKELGAGEDHEGIADLSSDLQVGGSAAEALNATDPVIDFEVTPNRPDWLGVANIARDLSASGLGKFSLPEIQPVAGQFPCEVSITIEDSEGCPAFAGRVVRGVKNGPSPKWVQDRLRAIGLRPISALVDITNLMSVDRARPLHVYDIKKLTGGITVRRGKTGEKFVALDDKEYEVGPEMTCICDESGVIGLGGVMGGVSTGVDETTTDVLIECALFEPSRIMQTGRDTGIVSDARYRFERGVDTEFVLPGMEMATQWVLDWCGGEASEVVVAGEIPAKPQPVEFELAQVKRLTGMELADDEITDILTKLGFGVDVVSGGMVQVDVPGFRRDVMSSCDLVEEVARVYGFDKLPMVSLRREKQELPPLPTRSQNLARKLRYSLASNGMQECVTWSFCERDHARLFGGGTDELVLANPISSELDCMRPSILVHLMLAAQRNQDRGRSDLALFEVGPTYAGDQPQDQKLCAAGVLAGAQSRHWQHAPGNDVFAVKALVEAALAEAGAPVASLQVVSETSSYWHPGRSGAFKLGPKNTLAEFGELHPGVLQAMGVDGPAYGFEIWPAAIPAPRSIKTTRSALPVFDLMPLTRDFAFLVDDTVAAYDLVRAAKGADKKLIADVRIFDVYAGKGVPEGKVSLAIEVTLQPTDKTLTDKDIEAVSSAIVAKVERATGAELRG